MSRQPGYPQANPLYWDRPLYNTNHCWSNQPFVTQYTWNRSAYSAYSFQRPPPPPRMPPSKEELGPYAINRPLTTIQQPVQKPSPECNQRHSPLMALPPELRDQIYRHVVNSQLGVSKVQQKGGRSRFRVDWTAKTLPDDENIWNLYRLMSTCRTMRRELLPMFLRAYIVKFPSWDPGFKLQCIHWLDKASEVFVNNIDLIWLEGIYWRFSICLGKSAVDPREDEKALREDIHQYPKMVSMAYSQNGIEFVLRIDYARQEHIAPAAQIALKQTFDMLKQVLVERGEDRLSKFDLMWLIQEVPLSGREQMAMLKCGMKGN